MLRAFAIVYNTPVTASRKKGVGTMPGKSQGTAEYSLFSILDGLKNFEYPEHAWGEAAYQVEYL